MQIDTQIYTLSVIFPNTLLMSFPNDTRQITICYKRKSAKWALQFHYKKKQTRTKIHRNIVF